jgi:tRNA pseudouridine38-40 synthase
MRFKATVAYDGSAYAGFQQQANARHTVLDKVEAALAQIAQRPVRAHGAGRTDAGVHATGQVIAFDLEAWSHSVERLQQALNARLPTDIAILRLEVAPPGFHPRFEAHSRSYRYLVYEAVVRHPLLARTAWHIHPPWDTPGAGLDVDRMNVAAAQLIGLHDFASFGTPPERARSSVTLREVYRSTWAVLPDEAAQSMAGGGGGRVLAFSIQANAFLYHMVRTIVAALVEVGLNRMTLEQFSDGFRAKDRRRFGKIAPAHGLTLTAVSYDESGTTPAGELEHDQ